MSKITPEKQIQCQEIFNYFDKDKDGKLSKNEFEDAIKTLGIFIPKEELTSILDNIPIFDYKHYEEICADKLTQKINKDEIIKAFEYLDKYNKGKCEKKFLKQAFLTLGEPLKENEIDELLNNYTENEEVDYKKLIVDLVGK
jgi:Ca2+-binding EF-hand superfamily protein